MYCLNCGKQIADEALFCNHCGARREEQPVKKTEPVKEPSSEPTLEQKPMPREQSKLAEASEPVPPARIYDTASTPKEKPADPPARIYDTAPSSPKEKPADPPARIHDTAPSSPKEQPTDLSALIYDTAQMYKEQFDDPPARIYDTVPPSKQLSEPPMLNGKMPPSNFAQPPMANGNRQQPPQQPPAMNGNGRQLPPRQFPQQPPVTNGNGQLPNPPMPPGGQPNRGAFPSAPVGMPPAKDLPNQPSEAEEPLDEEAEKEKLKKIKGYKARSGLLTTLVSIFLVPLIAISFIILFLNALTEKFYFPELGGIGASTVNDFLGSELTVILLGMICLLLMIDIVILNRKRIRKAFLALSICLLVAGLLSFGLGFAATYAVGGMDPKWSNILVQVTEAFSQTEMFLSIGLVLVGVCLLSISLSIQAFGGKREIRLGKGSVALVVVTGLIHIAVIVVAVAGIWLIASGNAPF